MDEQTFFAWLDGELDEAEAARVAAIVAADPDLAAKAEAHRRLHQGLAAAFAPVAAQPVPAALAASARPRAAVIDFTAARRRRALPSAMQWAAMAATLAVGLVTGTMIGGTGSPAPSGATLVAASLGAALDTRLAGDPAGTGARVGMTYRNAQDAICRSFTDAGDQGLACREDGRWTVKALLPAEGQEGDYRMAAGTDPAIAALIDRTIKGEPLDAAQERAARDNGWR